MKTERPQVVSYMRHAHRVGEGILPERSVGVKPEERRRLKLTHAWQLRTNVRLLTDSTDHTQFASGKSMHNQHCV